MTLIEALSLRINELLKEQGLSQYRLSILSGVSQTSISDVRLMRNNTVSIHIIFNIAQGFGMDLQKFFDSPLFSYDNILD